MKRLVSLLSVLVLAGVGTLFATATKTMVGQKLPELKLDYVGKKPDLAGKPMILEFWATWCGPCRQSIPHLNAIYKKYKDKGLMIVGVTDEDNQTIRKFTKSVPMDYFPATDRGGKLQKEFGVQGIPHAVLVNASGEIVWEGHPMNLKDGDVEKIVP
jgi:thiol-disulfide isomerase/thioredoxin